jgi:hypothetical protein
MLRDINFITKLQDKGNENEEKNEKLLTDDGLNK